MPHLTLPQLGRRIQLSETRTVLQAALDAGIAYPHSCRSGRCGACKSRLLAGRVELASHSPYALSEDERAAGLILACRAAPTDDVTVEWLDNDFAADRPGVQDAEVAMIERMTHDIMALRLRLSDRSAFRFAAGQYLTLTAAGAPARQYSMASRPDDELLELHIRAVPNGLTSNRIHASLKPGDLVGIEGPLGSAYLREAHAGPIVAIAGGSGLAPIKSIVETALTGGLDMPIHLYFGVRAIRDLYLVEHFRALARGFPNFAFVPVLSRESSAGWRTGQVSDALARDHQTLDGAKAYVAGPPAMVDAARAVLAERGVAAADIHADVFFTPEEPDLA